VPPAILLRPGRLAPLSLAAALSLACSTAGYHASAFAPPSPPAKEGRFATAAALEVDGLKIRIDSADVAREGEAAPPLALRLTFEPREIGYSFDPGQVLLRSGDGAAQWHPRVFGPGLLDTRRGICGAASPAERPPEEHRYYLLSPKTCFDLAFDVTVGSDVRLQLALGGLALGQKRLEPVDLSVRRRSWRAIERLYWLEVLMLPLAVP